MTERRPTPKTGVGKAVAAEAARGAARTAAGAERAAPRRPSCAASAGAWPLPTNAGPKWTRVAATARLSSPTKSPDALDPEL
eukprot:CAMPEP_0170624284 /NCGR_PEP_ID=MMETSP0224-20130122/30149_1 /TAXON_ID=285029 /ORGANISM="Togula jolla, Strain CCCM 725" /LENGTH=81 /DNA_ID=CAMNT_0010950793 /DNA_START=19 /DNA_END=261 /DNA_ORIENTATION=+